MAINGCKWLEKPRTGCKWQEWLEIAGNAWIQLEFAEKGCTCQNWLEMAGDAWIWLETEKKSDVDAEDNIGWSFKQF